jgi:protein TonB
MSSSVKNPAFAPDRVYELVSPRPDLAFDNLPLTSPMARPGFGGLSRGLSIGMHVLAVLGIIAMSLLWDGPLPGQQSEVRAFFASPLELASAPPPPPPAASAKSRPQPLPSPRQAAFTAPAATPLDVIPESSLDLGPDGGMPGGVEGGVPGGVVGGVIGGLPEAPPPPPARPVRVGGDVKEPRLIKNVPPVYPEIARLGHLQGVVLLECLIDPRGRVAQARVMHGVPALDDAAVAAVRQWIYTPTLLNGVPVAIVMDVTVRFRLTNG